MKRTCLILICLVLMPFGLQASSLTDTPEYKQKRETMVRRQIRMRGVADERVLSAMASVPRHLFVPRSLAKRAYDDRPLPIGEGQTISQPYIVALMTEALDLKPTDRVLEIGTGSGYQAAVLSKVVNTVTTIEIKKPLHLRSSRLLEALDMTNIGTIHGDGYFGNPALAPYDAIMITAAVNHIPPPLLKQLKKGAKLILPLGNPFSYQNLVLVTKTDDGYTTKTITGVLFVPLTGHALDDSQ